MKEKYRILCFGDSLTWGYDPDTRERFPENIRWTGVLQDRLGSDYRIIEEGHNARTIATDDPAEGEKNGIRYIIPCIESQAPLDLIIIMLGTNDIKGKFGYVSRDIAGEMQIFLEKIKAHIHFRMHDNVKILLLSPPHIGENIENSWLGDCFEYHTGRKKSQELADWYKQLSEMYGTYYLDTAQHVITCKTDSIHMDAENQIKLGETIAEFVKTQIHI